MNKALLKSAMARHGDTQEMLANAMDMSLSRLNAKINGKNADFWQSEINFIKERYRLSSKEINDIFFDNRVS